MTIRKIGIDDSQIWIRFRSELWPQSADNHADEIADFFAGSSMDIEEVFVVENDDGKVVGFIELNTREFAEGSRHPLVPYVEAWFVEKGHRHRGHGRKLMEAAENWARRNGFTELASDAEITNARSIELHKALGFEETERIVCFLKRF
jgi:aminoglycoside 6'-N-acetyltransferase I